MSAPRLTVAIWSNSGGGISGLCLAVALSRCADVRVELYEAAGRFAEIGAGVMIWSRTWRVLELMGLADAFSEGLSATDWRALKGSGLTFGGRTCLQKGSAFTSSSCHVSKLASVQAWSPAESTLAHTYFPQTAVSVFTERTSSTSSSTACLWASRTSTSASRLTTRCPTGPWSCVSRMARGRRVICSSGATGLRAACARRCCVSSRGGRKGAEEWAECSQPVFSGTVAYRGLVPVERLTVGGRVHRTVESPMMYCGKNKHVVSYSIARGSVVNVVAFSSEPEKEGTPWVGPWVAPCAREELLACYAGWEPEVRELLECIEAPTKWTLHDLRPLPTFLRRAMWSWSETRRMRCFRIKERERDKPSRCASSLFSPSSVYSKEHDNDKIKWTGRVRPRVPPRAPVDNARDARAHTQSVRDAAHGAGAARATRLARVGEDVRV
ncbi:hypothetical protein EW146_g10419 [Bondarzewia mesenterica]|uniref:FAD-binding domain-containing protein n=1 Tax=Bondarzewia mesenterica TaxID=1095465 RepID=A0A4S4KXD8_9AGAM|nr:hypothetical protein EW146_g10419 [Bondarzewia mesenterica]